MARTLSFCLPLVLLTLLIASLSGDERADPTTPAAAPGQPEPFLGTAVIGSGGTTAAVDAYGQVVDLRWPGPAGAALIHNPLENQRLGTVPSNTGIGVAAGAGRARPTWEGRDSNQRYAPGTNVLETRMELGGARLSIRDAADPERAALARKVTVRSARRPPRIRLGFNLDLSSSRRNDRVTAVNRGFSQLGDRGRVSCRFDPHPAALRVLRGGDPRVVASWHGSGGGLRVEAVCSLSGESPPAARIFDDATASDRRWLAGGRRLRRAPGWAKRLYERSLLALRALTDRRSGAMVAGPRDFWAYVWPRDAAAGALAFERAGYPDEARGVTRFLTRVDPSAGARFRADGSPVRDGRPLAGDGRGWIRAARARAQDGSPPASSNSPSDGDYRWTDSHDHWESGSGDFLGNALAARVPPAEIEQRFGTPQGLVRSAGAGRGLDSSAAWAVEPFTTSELRGEARKTLLRLAGNPGRYGITPGERWHGTDPWTAPTAWSALGLARLGERQHADALLSRLRKAATGAGLLPERLDARTGIPRSTTPIAWAHAATILALLERYRG